MDILRQWKGRSETSIENINWFILDMFYVSIYLLFISPPAHNVTCFIYSFYCMICDCFPKLKYFIMGADTQLVSNIAYNIVLHIS